MIKIDFLSYMKKLPELDTYKNKIEDIKKHFENDQEMLDWYSIDKCISNDGIKDLLITSQQIRNNCDVFIVIGIGGSFLGAKAVIDALTPYFNKSKPEIIFAGTSLSSSYLQELVDYIQDKEVIINVISKSGTTLEPSICFDYLYNELKKKYNSEDLKKRIIVTTDKEKGLLRELVNTEGFKSFEVPSQIGGRYSVLTPVGLLPIAVSGIDITKLLEGAKTLNKEEALRYAVIRDILYHQGKFIESFTVYEPKLLYFTEWLKQLFAETQGKEGKGIFPVASINTRDLHSLGQFYQEGNRIIFETVINIENSTNLYIDNYHRSLDEINTIASQQVALAHYQASTYSNFISIDKLDEYHLGYLIYFFEVAAATGGYLLDVNPFDQPGVNAYKDLLNEKLEEKDES